MPDSIPEVVGGLAGAAIDQSNGGDGMSGFEQGTQVGYLVEAVTTLPSAIKNADSVLDVVLAGQSIAGAFQTVDKLTSGEEETVIDVGANNRALQNFNAANEVRDPVHGNNPKP
jgi:hypothetical protein